MTPHFTIVLMSILRIESVSVSICEASRLRQIDSQMRKYFAACSMMLGVFFALIWFGLRIDQGEPGIAQMATMAFGITSCLVVLTGLIRTVLPQT